MSYILNIKLEEKDSYFIIHNVGLRSTLGGGECNDKFVGNKIGTWKKRPCLIFYFIVKLLQIWKQTQLNFFFGSKFKWCHHGVVQGSFPTQHQNGVSVLYRYSITKGTSACQQCKTINTLNYMFENWVMKVSPLQVFFFLVWEGGFFVSVSVSSVSCTFSVW